MLSLVHLIYMAGDKCMRQNACLQMKQDVVRLLSNFGKRFMGCTLHMIMCVLYYPVSIHMSQLLSTGRRISSYNFWQPSWISAENKTS